MKNDDTKRLTRRAIEKLGGREQVAIECGVKAGAVYWWQTGRSRPSALAVRVLEKICNGDSDAE